MNTEIEEDQRTIDELNKEFFRALVLSRDRRTRLKNGKDIEMYLCEEVFPVLLPAVEDLTKEIERIMTLGSSMDSRIKARFNPCIWIAQYLMRNNPRVVNNTEIAQDYRNQVYAKAAKNALK